jgi:hypothetical protein
VNVDKMMFRKKAVVSCSKMLTRHATRLKKNPKERGHMPANPADIRTPYSPSRFGQLRIGEARNLWK